MKTMTVGELKTHFSEVLKRVINGEEIGISYGKKKEVVACIIPKKAVKEPKRKLGILEGKSKAVFADNFEISEEEFLGL